MWGSLHCQLSVWPSFALNLYKSRPDSLKGLRSTDFCLCHKGPDIFLKNVTFLTAHVVVYKTSVLYFSRLHTNTQLKDTGGKRKIKRMVSFLSLDKGRLFFPKLSLKDETHEIFFMADWSVN